MGPSVKVRYYDLEAVVAIDSPNTPLGELLSRAKVALNIPGGKTNLELRYKQKPLDLLLPFRLSGIISNSTVEVVETFNGAAGSMTTVNALSHTGERRVAVAIDIGQGRARVDGTFAPNTTLREILINLGIEAEEPSVKSVRFMNRRIESAQFDTTSLQSLGLTTGSALFRLETASSLVNQQQQQPSAPSSLPQPLVKPEEQKRTETQTLASQFQQELPSIADCQTAVVTLMKIIRNVYVNPNDVKVRSLRTSNPAFKTKLKDAAVCFVVLKQAGFAETTKGDGETWYTISTASNASGSLSQSDLKRLEQVYGALSTVADEFMIPLSERPSLDAQSSSSSTSASEPALPSRQTSFEFDPFRTNVIGMSGAPTVRFESAGGSTLDQQVAQLKAKRDAIMRSAGTIVENRQLIAIAYSSDFNPRRFLAAEEEEEEEDGASVTTDYDAEERAVIAMHQKAMQEKQKKAENFQTKAMREYDQLSKARVYTRTLIRITFPDRSVLQGLFCPLETIADLSLIHI